MIVLLAAGSVARCSSQEFETLRVLCDGWEVGGWALLRRLLWRFSGRRLLVTGSGAIQSQNVTLHEYAFVRRVRWVG